MVNSKDFNKDYNNYYRPSLDDDFPIPSQGVLPLYYFENGYLRGTIQPNIYMNLVEEEDDFEPHSSNYIVFYIVSMLIICFFLFCKYKFNKVYN